MKKKKVKDVLRHTLSRFLNFICDTIHEFLFKNLDFSNL
jgi:hypothetical protein